MAAEAQVGDGNETAQISLIMGPRGDAEESVFCTALGNRKRKDNALILVAPHLTEIPATMMFNKVEIKNGRQAAQMFGPAQRGVAQAVADSVKENVIPMLEANNLFICVGVFIHWNANDDDKIQDWHYEATKLAIKRAVESLPLPAGAMCTGKCNITPAAAYN
jgi:5,6,7,8-tetrahydromethanopterin hydro-lyase